MNRMLLATTALSALAMTAPAGAQYSSQGQPQAQGPVTFEARIDRLETRIESGMRQGSITRDEAAPLLRELNRLADMRRYYSRDGFSREERRDLYQKLRELRRQIRLADSGTWDYYDRDDQWRDDWDEDDDDRGYAQGRIDRNNDGFDDRDTDRDGRWDDNAGDWVDRNNDGYHDLDSDRDGRWDDNVRDRIDRDNDGYDDRDYDRDGRWDDDVNTRLDQNNDGYDDRDWDRDGRWDDDMNTRIDRDRDGLDDRDYDRDGRWDDDVVEGRSGQQQSQPRGLIGTLLDTFLGGSTLRVGDRAPDNLGAVPYQYQNQYRDGNGVYFRSDGRAIYEIDVRTRQIIRVHALPR